MVEATYVYLIFRFFSLILYLPNINCTSSTKFLTILEFVDCIRGAPQGVGGGRKEAV